MSNVRSGITRSILFISMFALLPQAYALDSVVVKRETVPQERLFDGVIEAVHQSTVSAQLVGRITEINYDVDDFVPKGAVLLRFRDTEQKARLNQAKAGLEEATARHQEAADEFVRVQDVYAKKLVAKSALDKANAELKAAKARLTGTQAKVREAEELLAHTVISAPYAGFLTKRFVEVGETVGVGQQLMTGMSLETLRASVNIPQAFVNAVRERGDARVVMPDSSSVKAKSVRVFPYADENSHAFRVRVNLPQGESGVYPGTFVKVAFVTGESQQLLVPTASIVQRSELTAVYVIEGKKISFRQIRTGRQRGDKIEILAGLDAGESIAIDPISAGIDLKQQGQ